MKNILLLFSIQTRLTAVIFFKTWKLGCKENNRGQHNELTNNNECNFFTLFWLFSRLCIIFRLCSKVQYDRSAGCKLTLAVRRYMSSLPQKAHHKSFTRGWRLALLESPFNHHSALSCGCEAAAWSQKPQTIVCGKAAFYSVCTEVHVRLWLDKVALGCLYKS